MRRKLPTFFANGKIAENLYLSYVYEVDLEDQYTWPILKARFFEMGHSMAELNAMGLEDVGVVVAYLSGKSKGEEKVVQRNKRLQGGGSSSAAKSQ